MAIDKEDWWYLGAAAVGGALVGSLGYAIISKSEPVYTGLTRIYSSKEGEELAGSVWAFPEGDYTVKIERQVEPGVAEEVFPDMKPPKLKWPFAAAMWLDDVMWELGYEPKGAWAPIVNEASEARHKELAIKPA